MSKIKEKVYDWKNRLKDRHMLSLVVGLIAVIVALGIYTYKKQLEYRQASENDYNMAFYELVDYVDDVENYLAKSLISGTSQYEAENLTYVWREANLAQSYLARLPIQSNELANTAKFLNQVSDYSFTLSRKSIYNESLSDEDLKNLKELYQYSVELKNTLNQLSTDIDDGKISWGELTKKGSNVFTQQVSNISKDSFSNLEENFHEYAGLIYDGAFSEHMTNPERKGLIGNDINEEKARQIAKDFVGSDRVDEIISNGENENGNGNIVSYNFEIKLKNDKDSRIWISVSKKGGHIVFMNFNRQIGVENISQEKANEIGRSFLEQKGFKNMKATYFIKQGGIVTINYAFVQENVTIYSDLIKVKVALDNGEILGIETTGYLNSHYERKLGEIKVSKEKAREFINKDLEITSEGLAMIPTEYQTELLCWEFKGKVDGKEFLVYINVDTGREEDVLIILDTPNGTLTV